MRWRVVVLVYIALFVGDLSWTGITPLIPAYIDTYSLTDFEGGLVLSVASLGILVASLPASFLTRRVPPRTLTLASMVLITMAGFAMALASTYLSIVTARLVFGLGFGTLWVAMAAWLDDAAGRHSARVLALTTSIVGLSSMLGPAYAGWVAQHFGLGAPFVGLAAVSGVVAVLLFFDRSGTGRRKDPAPPTREMARSVRRDVDLQTMLLLTIAAAVIWMTADLLVPLRLDAAGYSVAQIGIMFSIASFAFVASSAITARRADRWARPRIAATATVLLATSAAVPALLPGVPAVLIFVVGAAITSGVIVALIYPFGLFAVARGHVTVAVMSALSNVIWALSGMAGPSVGGAFSQWAGDQIAFAVLALVSLTVAVLVGRTARGKVEHST